MSTQLHPIVAWTRDLALAYVGGLVLGAPVAVAAAWLTGVDWMATVCLLTAMVLLFVQLRRQARRAVGLRTFSPPRAAASSEETRRVA